MRCLEGLFLKALVFQHVVLFLSHTSEGQFWGAGPSQTISALVGDDVILPCRLESAADVFYKSVEWGRPDLEPRFVHVWHEGRDFLSNQNPSYKGRTSVSIEKLRRGDLSLSLSAVKHSDNGIYRCYFPPLSKEYNIKLVVGSVSSAVVTGVKLNSTVVVVQCKSKGWYPEPEVLWLDSEGNLLPDGSTETLRGPDDLYTVSSRVTVEKTNRDSFTCRVQQSTINQIRDIHIQIPELTHFNEDKESTVQKDLLLQDIKNNERDRVVNTLKEQRKIQDMLETQRKNLEEQRKKLVSFIEELKAQENQMGTNIIETEKKLEAAKKVAEQDKGKGNFELMDIILEAKKQLQARKHKDSELITGVWILLNETDKLHQNLKTKISPEERSDDPNQKKTESPECDEKGK
ncbi:butyrophilin subfamily 1 member A1-like [Notolabrus celidotus]|uniref:butyrophilin subfamily 1 member A1-like n=1 Tax=Notolabrus celidotus TaxID=1203425 RepID=UPI0014903EDA|nr:butyrophilin subfamily 1 member A1-like [Notolabrus celidotus]